MSHEFWVLSDESCPQASGLEPRITAHDSELKTHDFVIEE
jgi:hypothetical protein